MSKKIVIGLGFGDEGKGLTTSYLCSQSENPLVVRFNGGHQAGHTVVHKGQRHVFSSFGAGTLQGVPTYWTKYCTFFPRAVLNELDALFRNFGIKPELYVDPRCPVTTPYDLQYNQQQEDDRETRHGSVGVGFGTTLQRQEDFYKLHVQDLYYPSVLEAKLKNIASYYGIEYDKNVISDFLQECKNVTKFFSIDKTLKDLYNYDMIFEGAQGILLDQDYGFFPNVTRSNTTVKNIMDLFREHDDETHGGYYDIYYVTRSYQTRHGNGFMTNEDPDLPLKNNEKETNKSHAYQGDFRVGKLDTELLNYALRCDESEYRTARIKRHLVVTCMDQYHIDINSLLENLNVEFEKVYQSNGPSIENIEELNKMKVS